MILKIFLGLLAIVLVFVAVVATRPADFRVTRSATIPAPPAVVFAQINDLRASNAWSPWARLDPTATNTFEGPPAGVGATFTWAGNDQVGAGRMKIIESRPDELVRSQLDFERPFKATNFTEFTLRPEGDQTVVTWTMTGTNNFLAKAVGLFLDCDRLVGGQFEEGLANLQTQARTATNPAGAQP